MHSAKNKNSFYHTLTPIRILTAILLLSANTMYSWTQEIPLKKILVVVEGSSELTNHAMGDGRQLATLLGHFSTVTTVQGADEYKSNQIDLFDIIFYIGFQSTNLPPSAFMDDVVSATRPIIWINTGFDVFSKKYNAAKKYGFFVSRFDSTTIFDEVKSNGKQFAKGEPNLNIITIKDHKALSLIATAYSSTSKIEVPYILRSKNLTYIADSPFASAGETDRYLLFADLLHDILGEDHEESHSALIRIEDVDVLEDPEQLRNIADLLAQKGIPFLVSVIPFYVNPEAGIRLSLSDKPEFVDALKYMVKNGATIVMHGTTHQYKGVTASDFEFWDESTNKPIVDQTEEDIHRKLEMGIEEFMRNGLYPLAWETPHYTGSFLTYKTVAKYFSTTMEQRLSIENFDYSQFFPYVINKDLFGQKIYPENLGYVPLNADLKESKVYVNNLIQKAKTNLYVRDGFASVFFHPFLNIELLEQLVDGIQQLGFTYIDISEQNNWVKTNDRVILTGSQQYSVTLLDQYLVETYFDHTGEVIKTSVSEERFNGVVTRSIELNQGEYYKAEPVEYREKPVSAIGNIVATAENLYEKIFSSDDEWKEPRAVILWNHFARGAAYLDQESFVSVFRSVRIPVDTIYVGQPIDLKKYNIVIVPYAFVDSLSENDFTTITNFVASGGNIVTDGVNEIAKELGISYLPTRLRVNSIRDKYFPEEKIEWRYTELITKFEPDQLDEVFCYDEISDAPMIIGKQFEKGKVIYINSLFDPYSSFGYSLYPYLMEYVRKYFSVRPLVRRENLEMYFDPGFRHTYSIEQLIAQWVRNGIRIVHAAGWHEYPKYTYDYERLIRLAHANGILVYAWLEPPQVSQKFWLDHPEWREKNYKGEDVRPSWRYPVALTDDQCVDAMVTQYSQFLRRYDWDGVNIAEVYFEAARGLDDPNLFTPMHISAQNEFKSKYNIELSKIFDTQSKYYWKKNPETRTLITNYRVDHLTAIYKKIFQSIGSLVKERTGLEVIVTAMDELGSPELRDYIGVDMHSILQLQKEYGFVLQVEDPENKWSLPPQRYIDIAKQYDSLIGDPEALMLDLNILAFRKKGEVTPFPTRTPTGAESYHLINSAALGSDRFTTYSESSVNPQDMGFFASASAANVSFQRTNEGFTCNAPYHFFVRLPKEITQLVVDGAALSPFRGNTYLIPAGTHTAQYSNQGSGSFSTSQLNAKILSFTGTLHSISYGMRQIDFTYTSKVRALISLSAVPTSLIIDGKEYSFTAMKGNDCYSIFLPPGNHTVEFIAGDQFSFGINVTSLWSTTAIAIFGTIAIILMFLMYMGLKVVNRTSGEGRA